MIPAEQVNSDGTINIASTGASPASQILFHYTFAGRGTEAWHAQFTYNGFQYLEVRGLPRRPAPDTVTLLVTHAANRQTASFDSSSPMLNTIYQITKRALENNTQSVLTDCPDREKGPYTGDNVQDVNTDLTLFDMQAYEGQLVANMRTSQRPTPLSSQSPGLIANIAPEYHVVPPLLFGMDFLDEPNWANAVIVIPWELHEVYGDTTVMSQNYDAMVKWLDYEAANKAANAGNIPGLGDTTRSTCIPTVLATPGTPTTQRRPTRSPSTRGWSRPSTTMPLSTASSPPSRSMAIASAPVRSLSARCSALCTRPAVGSLPCSTPPTCTAGPGSRPCRTSTACCNAKRNGRCSACSPTKAWAASRGARSPQAT
jgi:hypothetical protein